MVKRSGRRPPGGPQWEALIRRVQPLVFRVRAGQSLGTAFAVGRTGRSDQGRHTMLATAWHVVEDAVQPKVPLVLYRHDGLDISPFTSGPCAVYRLEPFECDTALISVPSKKPLLRVSDLLPMPLKTMLARGAEIGWLGFPGVAYPELCFFHGVVSGHMEKPPIYLIDGIGISGVSGGPAFDRSGLLVGFVSAYLPNKVAPGRLLPGLMILTPLNIVRLWMEDLMNAQVRTRYGRGTTAP